MTHCFGLVEEAAAAPESHVFGDPDPFNSTVFPNDLPAPVHSTPAPAAPPPPSPAPSTSPAAPSLTEEQRKRMELNRQRALERKLARQQQQTGETHFICSGTEKDSSF